MERLKKITTTRKFMILLIAALLFTLAPYLATSPNAYAAAGNRYTLQLEGSHNYGECQKMMPYINQARTEEGVGTLTLDKELTDVAMQRAAEIAYLFDHTRPNRTTCYTACSSGRMLGENIAAGNATAYYTHLQWMNSPGHKKNLLTAKWKGIGLGHFYHNGRHYWVQVFSKNVGYVETRTGTESIIRNIDIVEDAYPLCFNYEGSSMNLNYGENTVLQVFARNQGWSGNTTAAFRSSCFNWSSSNPSIVTVDAQGNLKGVGIGSAIITAKTKNGNGAVSIQAIVRKDFYDAVITEIPDIEYTGAAIQPAITVTYDGKTLLAGRDYTVTYENNLNVGYGKVTLTGIGDYRGSRTLSFRITQKNIEDDAVISLRSWDYGNADYGDYLVQNLTVTYNGMPLVQNQDYEIAYYTARTDKKKISVYHIRFIGNYSGYREARCLDLAQLSYIKDQQYTGSPITPSVSAYIKESVYNAYGKTLTEGVDYRVQYSNNTHAGVATATILPLGDNFGQASINFNIVYPPYKVTFNGNKGKSAEYSRTMIFGSQYGKLPKATRKGYSFTGWYTQSKGGKKVTASTTFALTGNQTLYAQWKKVTVKKATIKSVKKLSGKRLKVTAKTTTDAKGYQIVIATNSKFTKNKKTLTGTTKIKTFKNLKKAKYYVKVRAYKLDSTGKKVYGAYSKVKQIRIK